MKVRAFALILGVMAALGLGWTSVSSADHVSISAAVSARLAERLGSNHWIVEVGWSINCHGVGAEGASYSGDRTLVDIDTGERIYLGGVTSAAGTTRQPIAARDRDRRLRPELRANCGDRGALSHGSETVLVAGGLVIVPGRREQGEGPGGSGGSGGGGGGPGGGGGGSSDDPTEPLGSGGCAKALFGTGARDVLDGSDSGDVIFGVGGDDLLRGRRGHDCLLGGSGNDRLLGQDGHDRLTGGRGRDVLVGGPGVNSYDAGPGNDYVDARNGRRERVRCGTGRDRARVDSRDRVSGCETIARPR